MRIIVLDFNCLFNVDSVRVVLVIGMDDVYQQTSNRRHSMTELRLLLFDKYIETSVYDDNIHP